MPSTAQPAPETDEKKSRGLVISWGVFILTFPLGLLFGAILGIGLDRESRGIAMTLALVGLGLFGTVPAAVFVSYFTIKRATGIWVKLHAAWPWLIVILYWFCFSSGLLAAFFDLI